MSKVANSQGERKAASLPPILYLSIKSMNVDQNELDRWARFANLIRGKMMLVNRLLVQGKSREIGSLSSDLQREAARTLAAMEFAGAAIPDGLPEGEPFSVSLELMTSSANCRLYERLTEALEAAREVDFERGRSRGWADFLEDRIARVEREVFGAIGRD